MTDTATLEMQTADMETKTGKPNLDHLTQSQKDRYDELDSAVGRFLTFPVDENGKVTGRAGIDVRQEVLKMELQKLGLEQGMDVNGYELKGVYSPIEAKAFVESNKDALIMPNYGQNPETKLLEKKPQDDGEVVFQMGASARAAAAK